MFPVRFLLVSSCVLICACGGGKSGSPTAPSTPAFQETVGGNVGAYATTQHAFTAPRAGQLTLTLTWASSAIDLDLYLTGPTCNLYPPLNCTTLATAATASGTTETLTFTVATGDSVKYWVDNFNLTQGTGYTVQVSIR